MWIEFFSLTPGKPDQTTRARSTLAPRRVIFAPGAPSPPTTLTRAWLAVLIFWCGSNALGHTGRTCTSGAMWVGTAASAASQEISSFSVFFQGSTC